MTPVLVTPPTGEIVSLPDVREHLRRGGFTEGDSQIRAFIATAVAQLDGWRGILGRCILSQQWSVTYCAAGTYRLPLPDVSEVTATDEDDVAMEVTLEDGWVTIGAPGTVVMTCALPPQQMPVVVQIIKLMVERFYDRLEGASLDANERTVDDLLRAVRAIRV